jgi:stage II sporulation protein B
MTFRFDVNKDEPKPKPKVVERWSSGGLGTAEEYAEGLRQEVGPAGSASPAKQTWLYEPDFRSTREAPPEDSYDYYSGSVDPRQEEWDEQDKDVRYTQSSYLHSDMISDSRDRLENVSTGNYGGSYHTRRPSYWWKLALSVTGAIGTGLLLGYAALSFFYGGNMDSSSGNGTADMAATSEQSSGAKDPAGVGTSGLPVSGTKNDGKNSIPVQVAAQSYYLLQYGVFSTPAGAEEARQELLTVGLAAGIDPADGNRVYAGMSSDREQAKLLSSGLKNQGIELYVREVALPGAEQLVYSGNAEEVKNYFSVSGQLLSELSSQSASLLSSAQTSTAANTSAVSDLHLQWSEAVKVLEQGVSPEAQGICAALEKSMSQGISALSEYNKNKAQGLLWEVQESMLSFLTSQKQLLSAMN